MDMVAGNSYSVRDGDGVYPNAILIGRDRTQFGEIYSDCWVFYFKGEGEEGRTEWKYDLFSESDISADGWGNEDLAEFTVEELEKELKYRREG